MGYLNGVNYSDYFGTKSFLIKIATIVIAGVAGLCVGKVGTYAYLGAMIGMGSLYLPISGLAFFHNDARKREFVSAGMACGIAAGFGAPIGGTLFSYEISQPNTFWEIQSTWRTFIAASISVVTYSFMDDVFRHGDISEWVLNSASLKFTNITFQTPTFESLPAAIIIGAVCGLLGAGWVSINTYYNMFRKNYFDS
jgi:H+/Cl- antiporter ClcA